MHAEFVGEKMKMVIVDVLRTLDHHATLFVASYSTFNHQAEEHE